MSSKPSEEGAAEVLMLLEELDGLDATLPVLERQLVDLTAMVQEKRSRHAELHRTIQAKLENMDCGSPGNYGWASRYTWLLGELLRQAVRRERQRNFPPAPRHP